LYFAGTAKQTMKNAASITQHQTAKKHSMKE
jgi:hypothetical protein